MSINSIDISGAISVFGDSLIVGDHDSVTLFGIHAQNNLKEYARKTSSLLMKDTSDIDAAIVNVLTELNSFEKASQKSALPWLRRNARNSRFQKECNRILVYIDEMTVYFRLQQAQLIKEIKILEKLENKVSECAEQLVKCINEGKSILSKREINMAEKGTCPDLDAWYARLEKRIDDLSVAHTISLQSRAQIRMLRENNLLLLDRVAGSIANTFPTWQNQISIMLGIDLLQNRLEIQNQINEVTRRHINKANRMLVKGTNFKKDSIDVEGILGLNNSLKKALHDLAALEANHAELKKQLVNVSEETERG